MFRALCVLLLAVSAAGIHFPWKKHQEDFKVNVCDREQSVFQVSPGGLKVSPYPPKAGQEVTVTLDGEVKHHLDSIKLKVNVHYGMIPLGDHDANACDELSCPINKGHFHMEKKISLPSSIPSGHYTFSVHGWNNQDEEVLCASISTDIN